VSGQVLSPDAIAALVEAAKEGRLPEDSAADRSRQRRMRTVDFTRPTKFMSDQERRIKRALETFCRTARPASRPSCACRSSSRSST
jgi:flagellar motor switch protein FliM